MILTCPACGTQYVVKDGAIPPGGRQVRCASCRHSWHQNPEEADEAILDGETSETSAEADGQPADVAPEIAEEGAIPAAAMTEDEDTDQGMAASDDFADADAPDPQAVSADVDEPPAVSPVADAEDEFTPFAPGVPDQPRRRGPLGWLVVIALIVLAALAFWYFAPAEWKARVGLAEAAETPLQLMMTHSDRQKLASGNELLAISGRVINPTQEQQSVPPITAQLRDDKGKLVYSWTIAPPAPSLKAGDSAPFYSAEVNVPAGGNELTVTLGAPKA
jgi:predicted Zn finger-like uncharacterized protein